MALPIGENGYLTGRIHQVSSAVRASPEIRRAEIGVLGGLVLMVLLIIVASAIPGTNPLGGAALFGAGLSLLLAVVSGGRVAYLRAAGRRYRPAQAPAGPSERGAKEFSDWAEKRYAVRLSSAAVAALLGYDEYGNTHVIDGEHVMLGTPKHLRPRELFGLINAETGKELKRVDR
jgi:hypothetical protein